MEPETGWSVWPVSLFQRCKTTNVPCTISSNEGCVAIDGRENKMFHNVFDKKCTLQKVLLLPQSSVKKCVI